MFALVLIVAPLEAQMLVDVSFTPQLSVQRFVAYKKSMFVVASEGVFRTDNRGASWQRLMVNGTSATAINTYQSALYAKTDNALFHSVNDGATWSSTTADLTGEFVEVGKTLFSLRSSVYPRGSSYAKIINNGKLFRSTTAGITWEELNFGGSSIAAVTSYKDNIFVAASTIFFLRGHILRSQDGYSWNSIDSGFGWSYSNDMSVGAFAVANNSLFATVVSNRRLQSVDALSSVGENVFVLDSLMQTWQVVSPRLRVNTLAGCGQGLIAGDHLSFTSGFNFFFYSGALFSINPVNRTWREITSTAGKPCAGDFTPGEIKTTCLNVEYPTFDSEGYLYLYNVLFPNTYQILRSAEPLCNASVAVKILPAQPEEVLVFPNPTRDQASISYTLTRSSYVRIEIATSLGQIIRSAFEGVQTAGKQTLTVDATGLATGVYCCRIQTESGVQTSLFTVRR